MRNINKKILNNKHKNGFTLVELLVVIGGLAILLAVVLVAVDPVKRLKQSRDSSRRQDVVDILDAIQQYIVDNNGTVPSGIDSNVGVYQMLGTAGTGCNLTVNGITTASACLDLSSALVPTYMASIPVDPNNGTTAMTGYAIDKNAAGRINVVALYPEVAGSISAQR